MIPAETGERPRGGATEPNGPAGWTKYPEASGGQSDAMAEALGGPAHPSAARLLLPTDPGGEVSGDGPAAEIL